MADVLRIPLQDNSMDVLSFEEILGFLVDIEYNSCKYNKP